MSKKGTNTAYLSRITSDGIAVVTLDHFPLNALSQSVITGLTKAIVEIEKNPAVKGVVVHGAGRCFCAGADISEFANGGWSVGAQLGRPKAGFVGFEDMTVPVVAAIHGFALGGGLETALDCHYRVVHPKTKIGLPEVNIGVLPGGHGTQRLPRVVGTEAALKMMTSGIPIKADKALKMGVVDKVVAPGADVVEEAIAFCRAAAAAGGDLRSRRISTMPAPKPADFALWRSRMMKFRRGEASPLAIIGCVEAAVKSPTYAEGVSAEAKLFGQVLAGPSARGMQHVFFGERAAGKVDGLRAKPRDIKSVGVIGGGLMGGGIAMCFANIGIPVVIVEVSAKGLERGLKIIGSNYQRSAKRGRLSPEEAQRRMGLIKGTLSYGDLAQCDMVIEAVFEDMSVKKEIFAKLDKTCKPDAMLCSNTSYLDIDEIASATSRPHLVMGTHFFSPANVMKLLENVKGAKTSEETIATCMAVGKKIGKWPVLVGNINGFVGNRMLTHYTKAAGEMILGGALPWQVDEVAVNFGMAMGPFAMNDLVGLTLGMEVRKKNGLYKPTLEADGHIGDWLIEKGRLGQKAKAGFYDYGADRKKRRSTMVEDAIVKLSAAKGIKREFISDQQILERLFYPLINEGFHLLEKGIAQRPSDIDVVYVHGYNFPRYRGGPMLWADEVGLPNIESSLKAMGETPAPLLSKCVQANVSLAKYWRHATSAAKDGKAAKL